MRKVECPLFANRKSRLFYHLTRLEEQAEQSTLSDNVAKRAKGKEWNQYQQMITSSSTFKTRSKARKANDLRSVGQMRASF
jgi:hypothetical protein